MFASRMLEGRYTCLTTGFCHPKWLLCAFLMFYLKTSRTKMRASCRNRKTSHKLQLLAKVLFNSAIKLSSVHRTKYQESVNGNVAEICETVAETRHLTRVSAVALLTFTRVSVATVTAEPYHFFTCFRQVSVEGNKCFRKRNFMFT